MVLLSSKLTAVTLNFASFDQLRVSLIHHEQQEQWQRLVRHGERHLGVSQRLRSKLRVPFAHAYGLHVVVRSRGFERKFF